MSSEMRPATYEPRITSGRSYPIRVDLDYRLIGPEGVFDQGRGQTVAMSRTAVWLESDKTLRVGVLVELAVTWPVRLDNKIPLRLIIRGRTVSADDRYAKVEILRHEFRTRALSSKYAGPRSSAIAAERTMTISA